MPTLVGVAATFATVLKQRTMVMKKPSIIFYGVFIYKPKKLLYTITP